MQHGAAAFNGTLPQMSFGSLPMVLPPFGTFFSHLNI
jgi:hypothetical protein